MCEHNQVGGPTFKVAIVRTTKCTKGCVTLWLRHLVLEEATVLLCVVLDMSSEKIPILC